MKAGTRAHSGFLQDPQDFSFVLGGGRSSSSSVGRVFPTMI